ncbi:MAG: hypothetical protein GWN00_21105 [Aliifodinibius sp.]|nr:hypothetical protein [Fodinibius sp.]NIY27213.1 hypothetical protein [Fodinibius sp.]
MREKHCVFAVLNHFGRCIAYCYHNLEERYERDCIGLEKAVEKDDWEFRQEVHLDRTGKIDWT